MQENSKMFKEKLDSNVIIEKNQGHFTGDDGITQLQIVLNELYKIF